MDNRTFWAKCPRCGREYSYLDPTILEQIGWLCDECRPKYTAREYLETQDELHRAANSPLNKAIAGYFKWALYGLGFVIIYSLAKSCFGH